MKFYHPFYRMHVDALPFYKRVLEGDADAAEWLLSSLSQSDCATVVRWCFDTGQPQHVQRAMLASAWSHDVRVVHEAAGYDRRREVRWFRCCAFPMPDDLPEQVAVYRGSRGEPRDVARGLSWATDFDVACFFAVHGCHVRGN